MAAPVAGDGGTLLRFAPFTSTIDSGFWHRFTTLKLEELKLSEETVPILGHYSNGASTPLLHARTCGDTVPYCAVLCRILPVCATIGALHTGDQPGLPTRLSVEFSAFQK